MLRKLFRADLWMVLFALLVNVVNYCFQIISGRFLTVEDYGLVNALFSLFLIFGAPYYAIRMIAAKQTAVYAATDDYRGLSLFLAQLLRGIFRLSLVMWGIVTAVYLLFPTAFGVEEYSLLLLPVVLSAATYYMFVPVGIAQGLQLFFTMTFISFILAGVKVGSVFIAAFALEGSVWPVLTIMVLTIAGTAVSTLVGFLLLRKKEKRIAAMPFRGALQGRGVIPLRDSLHVILCSCALIFLMNLDIILVSRAADEYTRGLYTASTMWGKILVYALMAVVNLFYPKMVRRHIEGKDTAKPYFFVALLCLAAIAAEYLAILLMAEPVIRLVFGERYLGSMEYIPYSYGIAAVVILNYLNMNYLLAIGRGRMVSWIFSVTALLCVISGLANRGGLERALLLQAAVLGAAFLAAFVCICIKLKRAEREAAKDEE